MIVEHLDLGKLMIVSLEGSEVDVLASMSRIRFLRLSDVMKEVVVTWVAVDTCCVGSWRVCNQ